MPSIRTFSNLALSALSVAQTALGFSSLSSPIYRLSTDSSNGASEACPNPQLSCHNTTAVANLCCFNAPGGTLLQTQFWDTNPVSGPDNSWTIHGLWPDNCDGTYSANCDDARAYTNITQILEAFGDTALLNYMKTYWTSNTGTAESFWEHEWGKHGTCISTLDPNCYADYKPTEEVPDFFNRTVNLFKTLPSYTWLSAAGIVPSSSKTYSASEIQAALSKNHGGKTVYLGCQSGALDEIWYFYSVRGSIQTGTFVPTDAVGSTSSCPSTGIKYLPKSGGGGSSPTSTATSTSTGPTSTSTVSTSTSTVSTSTSTGPTSTPTSGSFSGKGYLNVVTSGSTKGCIISGGTWYTTGTCATFTASTSGDGFTLTSSKGSCAVSSGKLECGSGSSSSTFSGSDGKLDYSSGSTFYADKVPSGTEQGAVYTDGSGHEVSLSIEWQSV